MAARHPVLRPDPAAVAFDEDPDEIQPETFSDAAFLPLVAMEDLLLLVVRDAGPGILDGHQHLVVPLPDPDGDLHTLTAVLDGVADEVREDLGEEVVGKDQPRCALVGDGDAREVLDLCPDDRIEIHRPEKGRSGVDSPDLRDGPQDLDALCYALLQVRCIPRPPPPSTESTSISA